MKRKCIFCFSTPLTLEHLFPAWIGRKVVEDNMVKQQKGGYEMRSGQFGVLESQSWKSQESPLEYKAKIVCSKCNNGWMSRIETSVKVELEKFIFGIHSPSASVDLTDEVRKFISDWFYLRLIMFVGTRFSITQLEDLEQFMNKGILPKGFHLWIAASQELTHYVDCGDDLLIESKKIPGYLMNIQIGHLLAKVFWIFDGSSIKYSNQDAIAFLHPNSNSNSILWPPKIIMDENYKNHFFQVGTKLKRDF